MVDSPITYHFGLFRVDVGTRQLFRNEEVVPIGPKAFDALVLLLTHRDRIVTKDELMKALWANAFVTDDSLVQTVGALRRALGDDPSNPKFVATKSRFGYRFVGPNPTVNPTAKSDSKTLLDDAGGPSTTMHSPTAARVTPVAALDATRETPRSAWSRLLAWPVVAALALVVLSFALISRFPFRAVAEEVSTPMRLTLALPEGTSLRSGAVISPDGHNLAYVADDASGSPRIWVRPLDKADASPLQGTEGAFSPFWSPDGKSLGFFAADQVKRVGLVKDPPRSLATMVTTRPPGGTWNQNGLLLYPDSGRIMMVPAAGGPSEALLVPDAKNQESGFSRPEFLPDGRHFLFSLNSVNPERSGTYIGMLGDSKRVRLLDAASTGATYGAGYLLYVRDRVLLAQHLDEGALRLVGDPAVIADNIAPTALVSASSNLLTISGGTSAERLVWIDRSGRKIDPLPFMKPFYNVVLSPDARQGLATTTAPGVWLLDFERGTDALIVDQGGASVWAPDGARIAFTSAGRASANDVYVRSIAGAADEVWMHSEEPQVVNDWSRDGRYLVVVSRSRRTRGDIWLLPTFGERKPTPFVQSPANEIQAEVSPDGRWLVYASDESGRFEIYVQSFPMPGSKQRVSTSGGAAPRWRPDGRELYYLTSDMTLMSVKVSTGTSLTVGTPDRLFHTSIVGTLIDRRTYYDPSPDGQRFLVTAAGPQLTEKPIDAVVNWAASMRR
jgi:DNA-binding winged helix-turn-helix (wHTH) protein/dipeptidyl aminopeptidase/acylaminoacyl peptidase